MIKRILIDIQGLQSPGSRSRGIGRYTKSFIKSLIKYSIDYEYILFANGNLQNCVDDFLDELSDSDLKVHYINWYAPPPLYLDKRNSDVNYKLSIAIKTYALLNLHPDLVIITSFFEGYGSSCIVDIDRSFCLPPILSIFYDLIPLLNPELYLDPNPHFREFYYEKIKEINMLDGLLCISQSAASEAIQNLEISEENVVVISSACDKDIFNTSKKTLINSRIDFDYSSKFILYSGAGDPRKNLRNLIEAYSLLPSSLIVKYKLVLAGNLINAELENISIWMNNFQLPKEYVITLGFVSEDELVKLYQNCTLFVLPSFHEGFGLPILEAMSCGAPVIGSNITSIPEVIFNDEFLFDPYDVISIKNMLEKILTQPDFNNKNKLNSLIQSEKFSWELTAKRTCNFLDLSFSKNQSKIDYIKSKEDNYNKLTNILKNSKNEFLTSSGVRALKEICSCIDLNQFHTNICSKRNKHLDENITWNVEGPFDSNYSLAILNRNFSLGLLKNKIDVRLYSTEGPGDFVPNIDFLADYPDILYLYNKTKSINRDNCISSRNLYPPRVFDFESKLNLLHAYGWEETKFP